MTASEQSASEPSAAEQSVLAQIDDWPAELATAGVTDASATLDVHGPADRVLPWASVTKLLTALGVLIAVQDGAVHLDEPAGPQGATVRHLLAHASGLPPGERGPTTEPGQRRIYSNAGYEILGELVADRVGLPFGEHLDIEVLEPLDMDATSLDGSPAHAASGSLDDLLALGRELLDPTLLDEDLFREATTVAFPGLAGVLPGFGRQDPNDWGLGFEIRDGKSPHWTGERNAPSTFGHFGQSGSFLWIDPEARLACASLSDRAFGEWAAGAWPSLADAVLSEFAR